MVHVGTAMQSGRFRATCKERVETMTKRQALGRGVASLIPETEAVSDLADLEREGVREIETAWIDPGPYQPRSSFDDATLEDLANSLRTNGLLQPLVV